MTIKLIAVDMDGTFLRDDKTYDRARFQQQYEQLKELGIHFVVASGNQLYRLHNYFDDYSYDFSYVAENGAYVTHGGNELRIDHLTPEDTQKVFRFIESHTNLRPIICGKDSAYVLDSINPDELELAKRYYGRLKIVSSYSEIDDAIMKIALHMEGGCETTFNTAITEELPGILIPVTSGHQFVDLIIPGVHKAHGLEALLSHLDIHRSEVIAFGDNNNDVEMLAHAGFGFAMDNAGEQAKAAARFIAASNNEGGVLDVLDLIIEGARSGSDFEELLSKYKTA
ncbi:Cof-type HAD-IIB family hydrolase [Parendozoicomonas haliclonae]|uniref:Flavin mononucleotide phosphatase YbjI n=1 Tax=Parendozoicomonas haliclonae TaxID=1960125 RepID=A0A1X7AL00_9GAMM|nr:Cof-type HAD-IIB family hydrolase [Parendozoicomonas haliclonae]SMA48374.1 Flavin mononucleotide phosphatase YbjI [Parendozoicomonas haliclonae]